MHNPGESNIQNEATSIDKADEALFASVDEAITRAAIAAGDNLRQLGVRTPPQDYFMDGVLRHLFLRLCGADTQTNKNGDPETAWRILYLGRNVARHWERERKAPLATRAKKELPQDIEKDADERRQLSISAERFALMTIVQVLLEQARASDATIIARLEAAIDSRLAKLDHVSETGLEFTKHAKRHLLRIIERDQ